MSPLDSTIYGKLYSDPEVARLFTDEAEIAAMIQFEAALARVQIALGVIPDSDLPSRIESAQVSPEDLRNGVAESGIPVPALIDALRTQIGETAQYLHWGATTQDVVDTALILRLRDALVVMERRLDRIITRLAELADKHRDTAQAGRTWMQHSTPTTFGLKCAYGLTRCCDKKSGWQNCGPACWRYNRAVLPGRWPLYRAVSRQWKHLPPNWV